MLSLFVVYSSKSSVEGEDFSFESILAISSNVLFKFVRTSVILLPVWLACNSTLSSFWFSLLHEVLSSNVGLAAGGIGDAIDEPIVIADVIRIKNTAFINPRVCVLCHVVIISLLIFMVRQIRPLSYIFLPIPYQNSLSIYS